MEQEEILECSNQPGIVACAVIPLMGGWTLRMVGLKKSSFITKDEHEACQLTRTRVKKKKRNLGSMISPKMTPSNVYIFNRFVTNTNVEQTI
jgi:hypothetical protein